VTRLTDGDIFRLDTFEGSEYRRIKVKVSVEDGGKSAEAETYLYTAGEHRLEKMEWSYEEFRKDKMHRWADNSSEYQGWISFTCSKFRRCWPRADVDNVVEGDPTGGRGVKVDKSANMDKAL
jgi:hypothetical protein